MNQSSPALAAPMRSKLFVPGNRPALFAKALASQADAVSFDFEDSVPEEQKQQARETVAAFLQEGRATLKKIIIVRTNGWQSAHISADLEAAAVDGVDCINLPKVESAEEIHQVVAMLDSLERQRGLIRPIALLANIESPRGLRLAHEIALADRRVIGLQIGYGDLFEPLGIRRSERAAVAQVQLSVRLAAGEAGIAAYDAAFTDLDDGPGYLEEAQAARRLGYAGKTCIHPSQIAAANQAFGASENEIAFSRKVLAAWQEAVAVGRGAITVDGQMIDAPYALRASRVLEQAGLSGVA